MWVSDTSTSTFTLCTSSSSSFHLHQLWIWIYVHAYCCWLYWVKNLFRSPSNIHTISNINSSSTSQITPTSLTPYPKLTKTLWPWVSKNKLKWNKWAVQIVSIFLSTALSLERRIIIIFTYKSMQPSASKSDFTKGLSRWVLNKVGTLWLLGLTKNSGAFEKILN